MTTKKTSTKATILEYIFVIDASTAVAKAGLEIQAGGVLGLGVFN